MGRKPGVGRKSGRPVRFSRLLAEAICERLAQGERWSEMSKEDGMPGYVTFYTWLEKKPGFAAQVAAARRMAADYCVDQALKVAEAATKDTASADRLRVDTLLKRATQVATEGRDDRAAAAQPDTRRVEVVFYARHFERYTDADGRQAVREVVPLSRLAVSDADAEAAARQVASRAPRKGRPN
ncbi:hypothetical protein [Phenylobacterium sp.]|uniref:terminase small subunit-like protein n=1 Tax=Phenylobacterium sp. TaxID=1871053 RepID=UPI00301C10EA